MPGPRVVLAQLADDQHVDLVERQPAHQAPGSLQQLRLDVEDGLRLEGHDLGGHVVGVLQDGQPEREPGVLDQEPAHRRQNLFHSPQAQLVNLAGPFALAQADHQHLEHARLVGRAKVGMRLDPVDQHDAVGLVGVAIKVDRQADGVCSQDDRVHVGLDGNAHGLGRHTVTGQQCPLALGRRAPVRSHRGHDERLVPQLLQGIDRRPGHAGDSRDPAAADPHGDRSRLPELARESGSPGSAGGSVAGTSSTRG